jgi:hypothetical protein
MPIPLPPGRYPVQVTEVTSHSFTFTALDGHFDPVSSTISFSITSDPARNIYQYAVAHADNPSLLLLVAPFIANMTWTSQADALRDFLSDVPPEAPFPQSAP